MWRLVDSFEIAQTSYAIQCHGLIAEIDLVEKIQIPAEYRYNHLSTRFMLRS